MNALQHPELWTVVFNRPGEPTTVSRHRFAEVAMRECDRANQKHPGCARVVPPHREHQ